MDKIISCEFNIDTACVEVKYQDGSMISIDCTRVENEVARNMYEASELDWLVYNAPVDYVNLLLHGDVQEYHYHGAWHQSGPCGKPDSPHRRDGGYVPG